MKLAKNEIEALASEYCEQMEKKADVVRAEQMDAICKEAEKMFTTKEWKVLEPIVPVLAEIREAVEKRCDRYYSSSYQEFLEGVAKRNGLKCFEGIPGVPRRFSVVRAITLACIDAASVDDIMNKLDIKFNT